MNPSRTAPPTTEASPSDIIDVGDTPEAWAGFALGIAPTVRVFSRSDAMLRAEEESRRQRPRYRASVGSKRDV